MKHALNGQYFLKQKHACTPPETLDAFGGFGDEEHFGVARQATRGNIEPTTRAFAHAR